MPKRGCQWNGNAGELVSPSLLSFVLSFFLYLFSLAQRQKEMGSESNEGLNI